MIHKVLLVSASEIDIERINVILKSHFSDIEIFSSNINKDLLELINSEKPDIIIFDVENAGKHYENSLISIS